MKLVHWQLIGWLIGWLVFGELDVGWLAAVTCLHELMFSWVLLRT